MKTLFLLNLKTIPSIKSKVIATKVAAVKDFRPVMKELFNINEMQNINAMTGRNLILINEK